MRLLWRAALSQGSTTYNFTRGQFGLILVRFAGTNAAGQTVNTSDLGNVILNWNGDDKINVDADLLVQLANVYGGAIENISAAGSSFAISFAIPTGSWWDAQNIYDISENDKVYLKLDFNNIVSKITNGTVSIYAKPRLGAMAYIHKILSRAVVSGGAGTITDTIPVNNISAIYIKDPSSLVDNIQIIKDGKVIIDGDTASELVYSNWIHLLETSGNLLALELAESKDVREAIGQTLTYKYNFTGAGNLSQYYSAIEFTPKKLEQSLANASAELVQK